MQQSIARPDLLGHTTAGLAEAPAVTLLGARQVGKTTLALQVAAAWAGPSTVFDLEVAATREALSATPERVLRDRDGPVVIDEVQRKPELFEVLRPICDDLGLEHLWVVYPGDRDYSLTDGITALPLTQIRDIELRPA